MDLPSAYTKGGLRRKGPFRVISEGGLCSPTFLSSQGVTPSPKGQHPAPHFLSPAREGSGHGGPRLLRRRGVSGSPDPHIRAAGPLASTSGSPRACAPLPQLLRSNRGAPKASFQID